ncbi:MAG: Gfo/Idh/MocA family oxidoreductase [Thermoflavifilum sp.]|nr:Gfo/Idh/MocA family oxidoreductase [Thermoflavifilum sp.]
MKNRKLRMGMVGGGQGAFIGAVHRIAARMDGLIELVCGAFSSDPAKSKATGESLFLPPDRVYGNFEEMINREAQLPAGERMDFVSIVTPNHMHFAPAKAALEKGFHVVLDKPMTFNLQEAQELEKIVRQTGLLLCLTHTYTGYPMVKEARQIVASGRLGNIRKVYVEYPQGWLSEPLEGTDNKQANWRTDPSKSGIAGCMGDIGTHAFNLAEYVTGLQVTRLCAQINTVVPGRRLDDDGAVLLEFNNGATGVLMASQIAAGEENCLKIRVYGEKGGLEWKQDEANSLWLKWLHEPAQLLRTGGPGLSALAQHNTRVPAGHPEGYLEAFANLYRNFALTLQAHLNGEKPREEWLDFPGVEEGVRGMQFIERVIASGKSTEKWIEF